MVTRKGRVWETPQDCRTEGCPVPVIVARQATTRKWLPFEAKDRVPFTTDAVGAWVLVDGLAWKPLDLVQHFQEQFETNETSARALVSGFPAHRIHIHTP